jgi:hypothetical protein
VLVLAYLNHPDEAIQAMLAFCSALALAHLATGR